ncbi:putative DNA double-strand break repair Rad50 ATPase [Gossypium australe]|uniref:Putative DNA double-strand break repair Rad50 ATPase n=1 Tax=Gossypium australe TaxID=47621 RepID=A0A5B6URM3_9ROSI|nr:putative DNA double-strand break repair Rad50 ATPase [Gossypium australe]
MYIYPRNQQEFANQYRYGTCDKTRVIGQRLERLEQIQKDMQDQLQGRLAKVQQDMRDKIQESQRSMISQLT